MKKREVASHFLKALKHGDLDYGSRHHIEPLAAEDNLIAVRQALQRAYGRFPSAEWIANLTGGTKPMSIATHEFFKALGGKLIYTNVVRPASLINIEGGETQECGHRLSIKEFLAGYGNAPPYSWRKTQPITRFCHSTMTSDKKHAKRASSYQRRSFVFQVKRTTNFERSGSTACRPEN
jgi:hypothetical protein